MKKIVSIGLVVTLLLIGVFVYADGSKKEEIYNPRYREDFSQEDYEDWHKEKMNFKREELEKALSEGEISKEEASKWQKHFDYMEEFHEEAGFKGCFGSKFGHRRGHHRERRHGHHGGHRPAWSQEAK